jgi:Fe-S-cluster-containing dehydrogenase component
MNEAPPQTLSRRRFLELLAAGTLAGSGCARAPREEIVPYVRAPEFALPGEPVYYATACLLAGFATGVLVECNEGRPGKVEGNPSHPASLGGSDVFAQAAPLQLWDPSRSRMTTRSALPASWADLTADIAAHLPRWEQSRGAGVALLTGNLTSDTVAAQIEQLRERLPLIGWYTHDALASEGARAGAQLAFGRPLDTLLQLDRARVIVSFDADFLYGAPSSVRYAHDFVQRRDPASPMSRLFALESSPGLVGAAADDRLALPPREIERSVFRMAHAFGVGPGAPPADSRVAAWESRVLRALREHAGECLLVAGESASAAVHALVHALNHRLGSAAGTFRHVEPVAHSDAAQSITELAARMAAGEIEALIAIGVNPAYDAPADLEFARRLSAVPWTMHLGLHADETARCCHWHAPLAHEFERWGDARAFDGTASIVQPLIQPLYGGHSPIELLGAFTGDDAVDPHSLVRRQWGFGKEGEASWQSVLREGVLPGSAAVAVNPQLASFDPGPPPEPATAPEILFRADASVRDGEFAGNAWLQELPRPFSKLTWANAACVSPDTAHALGLTNGAWLEIAAGGRSLRAPVWVLEEQADGCVTLPLGYGRTAAGPIGTGHGFDAYLVRESGAPWQRQAALRVLPGRAVLASTQLHDRMAERKPVRVGTLAEFARDPAFARERRDERVPDESLYPERRYEGYRWGMSIDLNACIGCNACVIACQSENNIPVVGEEQVRVGREMHWLRVDRYVEPGSGDAAPRTHFQPVPCMHCEHAPCEEVCPVGATVHDSQGLNLQVYNRCVGTRFCSQNCPYKVRRFNFMKYTGDEPAGIENPEVTVRSRGVMEKCTYCVQRITRARIETERQRRRIEDGEVVTACQAACPTRAIVFGDLNDAESAVAARRGSPRDYALLAELNTRPRTRYLAKVINVDEDEDAS